MDNMYDIDKLTNDTYNYVNKMEITDIVKLLKYLSKHYYNTGTSLVSDQVFDLIMEILEEKDPNNPYLELPGTDVPNKDKVKLPYNMPSLNKIKPDTNLLDKFVEKYKGPYVVSDKLDGVSGLYHIKGKTEKLYTKGDISNGQDISHLIKYVINKKKLVLDGIKEIAIRGELIISKNDFKKIDNKYANARNTVAGLVNSKKNIPKDVAEITEFIAYAVIYPEMTQIEQMKLLEKIKIPYVNYIIKKDITNEFLSTHMLLRRETSLYDIDGIVVIDSSTIYKNLDKTPDYGFAFKKILTDQVAEAMVLDVEWNVSKHGYIKPKIRIEPVKLVGVEITYATAHNAKFIYDNKLGPGAIVKIIRSGDVIPYIEQVIKPAINPKMPNIEYEWNDTKVDVIVKNMNVETKNDIIIKKITDFFKILKVKHISEGVISKLVNSGYTTIEEIIGTPNDELEEIHGLGSKIIESLKNGFYNSIKKTNLYTLMAASNTFGRGFGTRRLKLIIDAYPDIMNKKWDNEKMKEQIMEIEGFDNKTATQFTKHYNKFMKFYNDLSKVVDLSHLTLVKNTTDKQQKNMLLKDEKIVFTGFRDKHIEEFIEENGGKVVTSISSKTTMLIYVDENSSGSKLEKAIKMGIKIITLIDFKNKYKI